MAQVVKAPARNAGGCQGAVEMVDGVTGIERRAVRVCEDEAAILPCTISIPTFGVLALTVCSQ